MNRNLRPEGNKHGLPCLMRSPERQSAVRQGPIKVITEYSIEPAFPPPSGLSVPVLRRVAGRTIGLLNPTRGSDQAFCRASAERKGRQIGLPPHDPRTGGTRIGPCASPEEYDKGMNEDTRTVSGSICGYVQSYILASAFKETTLYRPWKRVFNWSTTQLRNDWGW